MASTYIDCFQYQRQPTGLAVTLGAYLGNVGRIGACSAGATSLTVPILTLPQSQYDSIYLFDGPNSEVVQVGSAGAPITATTLPLQAPTQYAHAAGTPYCTDGAAGSLGAQIFTASQWIEDNICFQALWATTYTGELLTMPTMRAALDNQGYFHFRPRHFPITALSSVTIQTTAQNAVTYDPTQAIIDSDQQTVDLPMVAVSGSSQVQTQGTPWLGQAVTRRSTGWIKITYTAGFALGALPWPIMRAATLLTSESFGQLENPFGADSIQQNKRNVTFTLRGDPTGESLLVKQAQKLLSKYIAQTF